MPVTPEHAAPYAPSTAIMEVVNRFRDRGLPTPITSDVLARAGIPDSLLPRTMQALQTLDLIDPEGRPTPVLDGIRRAPQAEYQQRLREWLTAAYADALAFVDPSTADEVAIRDAFRNYNPVGQQGRMVTLFTGLWRAAGVGPDKPSSSPKLVSAAPTITRMRPAKVRVSKGVERVLRNPPAGPRVEGVPPALAGLLASLPAHGKGWTKEQRDGFMQAFGAVITYCYPIRENAEDEGEDEGEDIANEA